MNELRLASRWLAVLLLTQLVVAPIANFVLIGDTFGGEGGFLVNAAPHATQMATAALLSLAIAVVSAAIAVVLWPVLRPVSERLALALALLGAAGIALSGLEMTTMLSMVSLSQAYVAAGAPDEALYQGLRGIVSAQRNWAHLMQLLLGGGLLLALYASMLRLRLVPRWLSIFGMLAALCQMIAVAKPLFGGWVVFPMLAPLGIANLLLVGWLLWKPNVDAAAAKAG
jgi:hypothetical protein